MKALILMNLQKTDLWFDYLERVSVRIVDGKQEKEEAESGALEDMECYPAFRAMRRELMKQEVLF